MLFSWILGILIFAYAGYTLFRHIQRGKEGQCAKCDVKESCRTANSSCCEASEKGK